jgi:acetyltransferase-like isoleucine patch superfamily enzyme
VASNHTTETTQFMTDAPLDTSKASIAIEDDVWIGANAVILPGVTIGRGAVIGAGSVVTKDVAPYTICAGNPARVMRARSLHA